MTEQLKTRTLINEAYLTLAYKIKRQRENQATKAELRLGRGQEWDSM
jgi:hypothetical protein